MTMKSLTLALMGTAVLGLSACSGLTTMDSLKQNAYYWQRANVSDSIYQEGPKAQQMLHRDIARCVTELRELNRLTDLRMALPADNNADGNPPDPSTASGDLQQWGSPKRDGYLMTELSDYPDFETCMQAKGWERMEHVPYDVAERSRVNYIETLTGRPYGTETAPVARDDEPVEEPGGSGPYDNLNH